MKVTYQKKTQNVPENLSKSLYPFRTFVRECFPNTPAHLSFLCQIPKEDSPIIVKNEEDWQKMMSKSNGGNVNLEVRQKSEEEEELERIENAEKENQMRHNLKGFEARWNNCKVNLKLYSKNICMVENCEELLEGVQHDFQSLKQMEVDPLSQKFKTEISQWRKTFQIVCETLENCHRFQKIWKYMEPIFTTYFRKNLPKIGEQFDKITKIWNQITQTMVKSINSADLLTKVNTCCSKVEQNIKEVESMLEGKRRAFPRFYFLDNDSLIDLCTNPQHLNKYVHKIFQNIHTLELDENSNIIAMVSRFNEKMKMIKPIPTTNKQVEIIFQEVEDMMRQTVRNQLMNTVKKYPENKRNDWIKENSPQCVHTSSQIWWTNQTEKAIESKKLPEHHEKYQNQLKQLVKMTREKLTKEERKTVNGLIIFEVHCKDVIEMLKGKKVENKDEFSWAAFVRQYWNGDNCEIKCMNTSIQYAYEFIGNYQRLVITPLTDRLNISLMTAFKLNLGGAPAGPAGAGKTESVQELARTIGQFCLRINCSDQLDTRSFMKIFTGVGSSGVWCCFDQFNRVCVEVLAAVSEQVKIIKEAKQTKSKTFCLDKEEISFNPNCFIAMTMNPGYAGRMELPENLKNLFRTVSMVVPDYALIGEIMLYAEGMLKANTLSKKIISLFKMFHEQFSTQHHYDFGMRAVKSVFKFSGELLKEKPNLDEEQIVYQAMTSIMNPKLANQDVELFHNLMRDIFPTIKLSPMYSPEFTEIVKKSFEKNNLQPTPYFVEKALELYATSKIRHGFMIIGQTKRGKSCLQKVTCQAMETENPNTKIHQYFLNPKSMSPQQLYGFVINEKERKDGVLPSIMRECSTSNEKANHWIVCDGPVEAIWIQNLNHVLDDNKSLLLENGERIDLTSNMRMVFETENLNNASPATVSRCGMIYLDDRMKIETLLQCWINNLPEKIKKDEKIPTKIKGLFEDYLTECMNFIQTQPMFPITHEHMIHSMITLLNCQIHQFLEVNGSQKLENCLIDMFHWCLVWSIGNQLNLEERNKFNVFMRERCVKKVFPEEGTVYDYNYDMKKMGFVNYGEICKFNENSLVVPTKDFISNLNLAQMLLNNNCPIIFMGPLSSGKSLLTQELIKKISENWYCQEMPFSRTTSHRNVHNLIEENMVKVQGNIFNLGNSKKAILLVEDMNMPKRDKWGDRTSEQILRWMMEHKSIWDFNTNKKRIIENMNVMGTICSNQYETVMSKRLTSKFNMIGCPEISDCNMAHIFQVILQNKMKNSPQNIRSMCPEISETCVNVLNLFKNSENQNCSLTLREPLRVVNSICEFTSTDVSSSTQMTNLFYHELSRVFCDGISNPTSRKKAMEEIKQKMNKMKTMSMQECNKNEEIVFSDYVSSKEKRIYEKVQNMNKFLETTNNYIQEYDASIEHKNKKSNIVLFPEICENISRICRVLKQSQGNMVLIGSKGCGKKSMTRIASYIMCCRIEEYSEKQNWENWIKSVMMNTVSTNKKCCVIVDECDLSDDMLSTLCICLKMDNIQCLFTPEEMTRFENDCKEECQERKMSVNRRNMMQVCMERLRRNFHCVVCMNPQENNFNQRIREFPTLMNESTVNWVQNWSVEGLTKIGRKHLMMKNVSEKINENSMVEACQRIHSCIEECCPQLGKSYQFCPSSFVEFVEMYKKLCCRETQKMKEEEEKIQWQIKNMTELEKAVKKMNQELKQALKTAADPNPITKKVEKCQIILKKSTERKVTWEDERKCLQDSINVTYGNCMMCAAMVIYGGMMTAEWREKMVKMWRKIICEMKMDCCENWQKCCQEICCLNMKEIRDRNLIENMMIIENTNKIPMLVDPQNQMPSIMCNILKNCEEELCVYNINESDCMRNVKMSLPQGKWVLIQGVNSNIPSVINELRKMRQYKNKMMISTNMTNLTMPVSTMSQVCVINCTMTNRRMEKIILEELMNIEHSNLCQKRRDVSKNLMNSKKEINNNDRSLLKEMIECKGNLLQNQEFVKLLSEFQKAYDEMKKSSEREKALEHEYIQTMQIYQPIAKHVSILHSCTEKMHEINTLARNSSQWFISLFLTCVKDSQKSDSVEKRIAILKESFTAHFHKHVNCQLFDHQKVIFSFFVACTMLKDIRQINRDQWNFFIMENYSDVKMIPNPMKDVPNHEWTRIYPQLIKLEKMDNFKKISEHIMKNEDVWIKMTQLSGQQMFQKFPEPYNSLTMFQKMLVIKVLCPHKVMDCVKMTIEKVLGKDFVNQQSSVINLLCKESTNLKPILLIIEGGALLREFHECAREMKMADKCHIVNLNSFNTKELLEQLKRSACQGRWLMIKDCHLDRKCLNEVWSLHKELMKTNVHKDFRLWLTSQVTNQLPTQITENCLKVAVRNNDKLKQLMLQTYDTIEEKDIAECSMKEEYMRLIFALSFLYANIMSRKKYSPLGMNIPYEWRVTDFETCIKDIKNMLNSYKKIQWDMILYMVAEICFGARVREDYDRRLMNELTKGCLHSDALKPGYKFCETVCQPKAQTLKQYREYINTLPHKLKATDIGLTVLAESTMNTVNGYDLVKELSSMKEMMTDECKRQFALESLLKMEKALPMMTAWKQVSKKHPICYEESMNTLLAQETWRYQELLKTMRDSICKWTQMLKKDVRNDEIEDVQNCLFENKVFYGWSWKSFASTKPLSSWIEDVRQRVAYIQKWIDEGTPKCLDMSKIFHPQGVISFMKQKYSRKHVVAIDTVSLEFKCLNMKPEEITKFPEEGCYITGMYMQGGKWDSSQMKCVVPPESDVGYSKLPVIHFIPSTKVTQAEGHVRCPLYILPTRKSATSSAIVRTNFIIEVAVPEKRSQKECVEGGMAIFLSLE